MSTELCELPRSPFTSCIVMYSLFFCSGKSTNYRNFGKFTGSSVPIRIHETSRQRRRFAVKYGETWLKGGTVEATRSEQLQQAISVDRSSWSVGSARSGWMFPKLRLFILFRLHSHDRLTARTNPDDKPQIWCTRYDSSEQKSPAGAVQMWEPLLYKSSINQSM